MNLYDVLLRRPLIYLTLNGPTFSILGMKFGFYGGKEIHKACEEITGISSTHWQIHDDICLRKIETTIDRHVICLSIVVYFYFLFVFLTRTMRWAEKKIFLKFAPDSLILLE